MKPKIFSKKLFLNKETVAHLNGKQMTDIVGGVPETYKSRCCIATRSCPTNNSVDLACCCGGDTTIDVC